MLSKAVANDTGVLVRDGQPTEPLSPGLRGTGSVYPAGSDRLGHFGEEPGQGLGLGP